MNKKTVVFSAFALTLLIAAGLAFFTFPSSSTTSTASADTTLANSSDSSASKKSQPKSGLAAYDKNGDGIVYQGGMHPNIVQDEPGSCPICGMDLNPVNVNGVEEGIVKIDPATIQNVGVRTAPVTVEPLGRTVRTTGHFMMDEEGSHTVSLKVGGWVEKLYADYDGQMVKKGEPLLKLYSPKLVSTQEEYLLALQNARRLKGDSGAQRLLEAARRRLAYWDLTDAQIKKLKQTGQPQRTITFYAPASGEVMHKKVVEGQHIKPGEALMTIMDISKVWLIVDVYEQDLAWVSTGTPARIELASQPGKTYKGQVDYIYHMLNKESRSARARIELPGGHNTLLKPGAYATVYLEGQKTQPAPVVPAEAVVHTGDQEAVILALGDGRFRPQTVTAGLQNGGKVQILEGLKGGEQVVTSAQFLIDSEAKLSSALGAMASDAPEENNHAHPEASATSIDVSAIEVLDMDTNGDGFVYQGPMHPEEIQDEPGKCSVCGMNLKRVPVEEARQKLQTADRQTNK